MMRLVPRAVALMLVAVGVQSVLAQGQNNRPGPLRDINIEQKLNAQVPLDLPFRDEAGKAVKLGDYFGKRPVILALVYFECPMLCTYTLNGLGQAMKELPFTVGDQYEVVTVSFAPDETPTLAAAKKESYLKEYAVPGGDKGWHFLTGDETSTRKLADTVGFHYKWDAETKQYAHATGLMILTPEGRVARYFYGVDFPARDLRLALVEASSRKIGSRVDQVLLFCFHYNPVTGKYSLIVDRILQIAGVGTVVAILGLIGWLIRRERSGKRRQEGGNS